MSGARAKSSVPVDRWKWQQQIAQPYGPGNVVTRAVLLIISTHMDADGSNGFPSQMHIAKDAGITDRAAREHLELARRTGWVRISVKGKNGKGWALHQYHPVIPKSVARKLGLNGAERGSGPVKYGAERHAVGAEQGSGMVRNKVPTTLTNYSNQILLEPDACKQANKNMKGSLRAALMGAARHSHKREAFEKEYPEVLPHLREAGGWITLGQSKEDYGLPKLVERIMEGVRLGV